MPQRRQLKQQMRSLVEIREILNSMKSLAYMETHKLMRRLENQEGVVPAIERAAADFLSYYPYSLPEAKELPELYIVIGAERGFCGDFNDQVKARVVAGLSRESDKALPRLIVVGSRLCAQFAGDSHLLARIPGADTADEIENVRAQIADAMREQHPRLGPLSVTAVYRWHETNETVTKSLLPPFRKYLAGEALFPVPPLLHMEPPDFLLELASHYVLLALDEILCTSLLAESHSRLRHLDGAVRYMDKRIEDFRHKGNRLRQEEIVEEIEVILMSASGLEQGPVPSGRVTVG